MSPRMIAVLIPTLLLCASSTPAQDTGDLWQGFQPLVGRWSGEGEGFGSVSSITHAWEFVFDGKFLRLRTTSTTRAGDGQDEIHEDVGFLSYDRDHSAFVFRQFLSEGFVNTFDVSVGGESDRSILFGARESESAGGTRVQMRLRFLSETEYEMVLNLATPGKEFSPCQHMRLKRVD